MAHLEPLPMETTPELQEDFAIFERILGFPFTTNYEKTLLGFVDTESMSASRPELFRL